jgi:hypothetical protein
MPDVSSQRITFIPLENKIQNANRISPIIIEEIQGLLNMKITLKITLKIFGHNLYHDVVPQDLEFEQTNYRS